MLEKVGMTMKFRTLRYQIKEGVSGLFKNRLMSLAAIITVMACVFILIISLCIVENISYVLEQIETKISVSVFLGDKNSDQDIAVLEQRLKEVSHVSEIKYVSKEGAMQRAKETWNDSGFLKGFEEDNPFPRSFDLFIDNPENQRAVVEDVREIQKEFEKEIVSKNVEQKFNSENGDVQNFENSSEAVLENSEDVDKTEKDSSGVSLEEYKNAEISTIGTNGYEYIGIEKIRDSQSMADSFAAIKNTIRIMSSMLIIIMAVVATGIIVNTIKLTVFVRRNEINIMKYVGATDKFIRGPFVVEGILIGITGAIIPCIVSWLSYDKIINLMYDKFAILRRLFELCPSSEIFSFIVPLALIIGAGIGALGSITSVRKHLNV